jgi:ATP-dependent exoDNAse (exonuclease V) beta subunit
LTEFLREDDEKVHSEKGIRAHEEWQLRRKAVRQEAGKPEWTVVTATSHANTVGTTELLEGKSEIDVTVESLKIDFSRPHGKRFGTLVHAILSLFSLNSDKGMIGEIAQVQGRILGASEEEVIAAVETVSRAVAHPLMQRAAAAMSLGTCRREVPLAMQLEDAVIVEGVVDLAFKDRDHDTMWTVVDYKTDFEMEGRLEEYLHQVRLYGRAISQATGESAQGILLRL